MWICWESFVKCYDPKEFSLISLISLKDKQIRTSRKLIHFYSSSFTSSPWWRGCLRAHARNRRTYEGKGEAIRKKEGRISLDNVFQKFRSFLGLVNFPLAVEGLRSYAIAFRYCNEVILIQQSTQEESSTKKGDDTSPLTAREAQEMVRNKATFYSYATRQLVQKET